MELQNKILILLLLAFSLVYGNSHPKSISRTLTTETLNESQFTVDNENMQDANNNAQNILNLDPNNQPEIHATLQSTQKEVTKSIDKRHNNIGNHRNCCHMECQWRDLGHWYHDKWHHDHWHSKWKRICSCSHYCHHQHHHHHHENNHLYENYGYHQHH